MNIENYKAMRVKGMPAQRAFDYGQQALQAKGTSLDWSSDVATWEQDGFELRATVKNDDYPDLSYLGEFTDKWQAGARHHEHLNRQTFEWFVPMVSEEEHYQALRDMKYGRGRARELARSSVQCDFRRLINYGNDWVTVGIVLTVFRSGIELGDAAVWGIESDCDEGYLTEMALDLAGDALEQARAALERLCGASSEMH